MLHSLKVKLQTRHAFRIGSNDMPAKNEGTRLGGEERGELLGQSLLLLLAEEVEEVGGMDGGEPSPQGSQRRQGCEVKFRLAWRGSTLGNRSWLYERVVENVARNELRWERLGRRLEDPVPDVPEF